MDDHDAHPKALELVLGAHGYGVVSTRDRFEALTYLQVLQELLGQASGVSASPDALGA